MASEAGSIDGTAADLARFAGLLAESDDLRRLVRSPVYPAEVQLRALKAVMEAAGIKGLAFQFIGLAAQNRRLFAIEAMITAFRGLVARAKGETNAEVISAEPLSAAQTDALKAQLKAALGRDVTLSTRVDSSILGGLIVKAGSRMVDNSLRTKLQNLKVSMKGVG
jgi:F-type H+-transporting ATPase subunit delta